MTLLRQVSSKVSKTTSMLAKCRAVGTRHAHTRRDLPYPIEGGLGRFLPPKALETLVEYQDGLLARLDDEMRTDPNAERHNSVAQIALNYAKQRERSLAFNYAVLAWNNSFFLDNLRPPPPEDHGFTTFEHKISDDLLIKIREYYGGFPSLKSTFSASALGMFTNGWVWLVVDTQHNLGILPTFGPSTLLIRSRTNMTDNNLIFREPSGISEASSTSASRHLNGSTDSSGIGSLGLSSKPPVSPLEPHARAYSSSVDLTKDILSNKSIMDLYDIGNTSGKKEALKVSNVGDCLYPLFCLPTYEHAWLSAGFGVWGKEDWLKEFWTVLDWEKVSKTYAEIAKRTGTKQ